MNKYHQRRPEKMITDRAEMVEIIQSQKYLTLALAKDNEPYIVTVSHAYDQATNCFYFHCSPVGKKMDYFQSNLTVWGQILEDKGYVEGDCDHAYRTVQFKGTVEFLESVEEKRHALHMLIDQLEINPEPMKKKFIDESSFKGTVIAKIKVEGMSGKKYIAN